MKNLFKKILSAILSIGFIFIIAMLGAIGGQGFKEVRRFILPAVVMLYALFVARNWWVLTIYFMSFPLSMGYGIPDATDEGSSIGRFFYNLFNQSEFLANIFTRGFVALLISITMLSVPIVKGTWLSFFVGSAIIIGIWASISYLGFGEWKVVIFGKELKLLVVDLIVYAVTTCGFLVIIHGILG